ncbi:MAG: pseudouridine synthase [Planctomycetota bacterium]
MAKQRIQKLLAAAGFGSRRKCEELVLEGRVRVNGERITELPLLADPDSDTIMIDGETVRAQKHVYFMLNKPSGVFCTHNDPDDRTKAVDLLVGVRERVYPIGRLDAESMGLLLFTNDGALAQQLTHPRFGVLKTYRVEVTGMASNDVMNKLRAGVWLSEGRTAPAKVEVIHSNRTRTIVEITLRESRNREIRRMLAKMGHNVRRMIRVRIGRLSISRLPVGAFRALTNDEVKYLRSMADKTAAVVEKTWKPAPRRAATKPRRAAASMPRSTTPARTIIRPDSGARPASKSRR